MEIGRVGVVGCGTMGAGICEVVARAGMPVSFVEVSAEKVADGYERISQSLQRAVTRGKLTAEDQEAVLGRISGATAYDVLVEADLVVEAVPEQVALKHETFRTLDRVLPAEAILATNTSSLAVTGIAVDTRRADRVVGFHFFNPAPVMPLIELITTVVTSPAVIDAARAFAERIGKTPVVVHDRAGFVANLLLFPYLNQAVGMLEAGYATREDIDSSMQFGAGHPMGPLAVMDLIGLDSANAIMERMYEQFGDTRHAPRPMIRQLLTAGFKGRKTGRGFYRYVEPNSPHVHEGDVVEPGAADPAAVAAWSSVGVLGTGTMAAGIAEVSARAGFDVALRGRTADKAGQAALAVARSLDKAVERGRLAAGERDAVLHRIHPTADVADVADCDVVIEAIAEDLELKRGLFAELDRHAKPTAVLATTTSSRSVIACAMATQRPEQVLGLHFFNPAARMRLVEVVPTARTAPAVLEQARAFTQRLGKHAAVCGDRAGFIVNALLFPYLNDAVKMLDEGYATVTDIDAAMKLGCGHPMGPFELMDVVGLDVTLEICRALHAEFREPGFAPADLLGHMVSAGYLGRKSGRGFHVYG
ncbi:MAG: 3-hydroxybutyryl-CoA dehydrogenase [Egibacteraceae bacterium]